MRRIRLIIFSFFVLTVTFSISQDAVFSQYFTSGIYFNPVLAATETSVSLSGITRSQWKGVGLPYQTSMLALTLPIKDKFEKHKRLGGVTVSVFDDKAGDNTLKTTAFNVAGAYGFNLSQKNLLFFGIMGGYYKKTLDKANFQWGSQYDGLIGWDSSVDPGVSNISSSIGYIDVNAGLLAVHELDKDVGTDRSELFLGVSTYHLTTPNESLVENNSSKLPVLINANLGALLPLAKHIGISPNLLYVHQGDNSQVNVGIYTTYYFLNVVDSGIVPNNIELGVWHRIEDSFIFNVGVGNEIYHLGFSYDLNSSNLTQSSSSLRTYEISFKIHKPHGKTERHYTPRF